ncbi:MAG TPA: zinc-dependent alcohol dehydrogenase [Opitutaceae bacterium]|nr:zinc-dependent alcohol dehydrogenase [Opitutaceae bacterium]
MKAAVWMGKKKIEVQTVPDPQILNPQDCIVKITATAICGSDIHLYDGVIPTLEKGDILGHEFMGEIIEVGRGVKKKKVGDRVVVPFTIACGGCSHCRRQEWACCDNTNPNAEIAEQMMGYSPSGLFGYAHMTGGYAGGQAQYVRVPFADVGPITVENSLPDEKVLFLSDIFPTGYMAAENCHIVPGKSVVAVWGCGPVGQFAIRSAFLLGAAKVIAIDSLPERRAMAEKAGAITLDSGLDVMDNLKALTGGRGPDAAIDAVGMEAHGSAYDNVKQALKLETDRPFALRQAMRCVRKAGVVSVPGVYGGVLDKVPFGAVMNKGVTIKTGQTHMQRYLSPLLALIEDGKIDPSFVITHRIPLTQASEAYDLFTEKKDACIKVVLDPMS